MRQTPPHTPTPRPRSLCRGQRCGVPGGGACQQACGTATVALGCSVSSGACVQRGAVRTLIWPLRRLPRLRVVFLLSCAGPSGAGKTLSAMHILGIQKVSLHTMDMLQPDDTQSNEVRQVACQAWCRACQVIECSLFYISEIRAQDPERAGSQLPKLFALDPSVPRLFIVPIIVRVPAPKPVLRQLGGIRARPGITKGTPQSAVVAEARRFAQGTRDVPAWHDTEKWERN